MESSASDVQLLLLRELQALRAEVASLRATRPPAVAACAPPPAAAAAAAAKPARKRKTTVAAAVAEGDYLRDAEQEQIALTPLQRNALDRLLARRAGMLFSAPVGFGKTRTGLALLRALLLSERAARALVLVPNDDIARGWAQEMSALGLRAPLLINERALPDCFTADERQLLIATHRWAASEPSATDRAAGLPAAPDGAARLHYVVHHAAVKFAFIDEAHAAKNTRSQLHAALRTARGALTSLYLATATPAANLHCDLWSLLRIIDPALRDTSDISSAAAERYMVSYNAEELDRDGAAPASRQEFHAYNLPGHAELDRALHDLRRGSADAAHIGSKKMELFRQFATLKLGVLPEQIAQVYAARAPRTKVVIFFFHKALMTAARDRLRAAGARVDIFNSETTKQDRKRMLARHALPPEHHDALDVLVVGLLCGGVGLNMQHAQEVWIAEAYWHASAIAQAVGRVVRRGQQHKDVVERYFFSRTGFDTILLRCIINKTKLSARFVPNAARNRLHGAETRGLVLPAEFAREFGLDDKQLEAKARAAAAAGAEKTADKGAAAADDAAAPFAEAEAEAGDDDLMLSSSSDEEDDDDTDLSEDDVVERAPHAHRPRFRVPPHARARARRDHDFEHDPAHYASQIDFDF